MCCCRKVSLKSLKISILPLNKCFSYRNVLQNGVNAMSKMVLKMALLLKSSNFLSFRTVRFGSNFASMWSKCVSNNVRRDFRLLVSVFATVARKTFNGKVTAKNDFPIGHFLLPLLTLTLEVKSLSIHYLISILTTCWWILKKIVKYEIYKMLSFLTTKWLPIFEKGLTTF